MNRTLSDHLASTYFAEYQQLRVELVDLLEDADLSRDVGGSSVSLVWYADLDRRLMAALEELSDADVATRRIVRTDFEIADFSPLATVQLDIYREALLIFYAKASVYLRSMSKNLPPRWQAWIG